MGGNSLAVLICVSSRKYTAVSAMSAILDDRYSVNRKSRKAHNVRHTTIVIYSPTFLANAIRTTSELSIANGAIDGSIYSGKILESFRGTSLIKRKQVVRVSKALTRTLATGSVQK